MFELFGPWDHFGLTEIRAFFKDAGDEGATWEAKADKIHADHVKDAASAFGNSREGGFLILGATQDASGVWSVPGVTLRDEAPKWIASVLRTGVRPVPDVDVRAFPLKRGSRWPVVVVVRIAPVALPPCITRPQGRIFERTVGYNVPITDPSDLARLYQRGDAAKTRATQLARGAAESLVTSVPGYGEKGMYSVAMAPVATMLDPVRATFSERTLQVFSEMLERLKPHPKEFSGHSKAHRQHRVDGWVTDARHDHPYAISLGDEGWAGAVRGYGEGHTRGSVDVSPLFRHGELEPAWQSCLDLLDLLRPVPPVRVFVRVRDFAGPVFEIDRWVDSLDASEHELVRASVVREHRRALGHTEVED